MKSQRITVNRLAEHREKYPEIKDPSLIVLSDNAAIAYTTICNSDTVDDWAMGRFAVDLETGIWQEIEPVVLDGLDGPEACAPAMRHNPGNADAPFEMYLQKYYSRTGGGIYHAVSRDGIHFSADPAPVISPEMFPALGIPGAPPVAGVYDVSIAAVTYGSKAGECLLYTGISATGVGDVYFSTRDRDAAANGKWSKPQMMIPEKDVACHNRDDGPCPREWCLEGMNPVPLEEDGLTVVVGVCFLPEGKPGTRQRVVMLAAENLAGPYALIGTPFDPAEYGAPDGENGHPDVIDRGGEIDIVFQARDSRHQPWHMRQARIGKAALAMMARQALEMAGDNPAPEPRSASPLPTLSA